MLVEVFGEDATISRTTASRIASGWAEFDAWNRRELSKVKLDSLELDGSFCKLHQRPRPSRGWPPGHRPAGHLRRRQGPVHRDRVLVANSLHQRCLVQVGRNLIAKVPTHAKARSRGTTGRSSTRSTTTVRPPSPRPPACQGVHRQLEAAVPSAVAWVADTSTRSWSTCCSPASTALIEGTLGETRRRVKLIGRLPGEQSCLSLVWAVLDRAAKG